MFGRLQRYRSEKSVERIEFKFSQIQIDQVPKGWDKLVVSIVSSETGKAIAKSNRSFVRDGTCQWTETFSESILISDDDTTKDTEERLYKLVISMGTVRPGILGEAVINLADYVNSKDPQTISVPLTKCSHRTLLQVNIQCIRRLRGRRNRSGQSVDLDIPSAEYDNLHEYPQSETSLTAGFGTSSSKNLDGTSRHLSSGRRDMDSPGVPSQIGFLSRESSLTGTPSRDSLNGDMTPASAFATWQDLEESKSDTVRSRFGENRYKSNSSSFNASEMESASNLENLDLDAVEQSPPHAFTTSHRRTPDPKASQDTAESTMKELRSDAAMWERTAEKLKREIVSLRKELSEQSELNKNLGIEMSKACADRDSFRLEVEDLKKLHASREKLYLRESTTRDENLRKELAELKEEIEFQKESNSNLNLQLSKTQESNMNFIAAIQELEETIEKQRIELETISADRGQLVLQNDERECEDLRAQHELLVKEKQKKALADNENPILKSENKTDMENENLAIRLQETLTSQKDMQSVIISLQREIDAMKVEIEHERNIKNQDMLNVEAKWKNNLSVKEEKILNLEAQVRDLLSNNAMKKLVTPNSSNSELLQEIEDLKSKVEELEKDCSELTDENLELILKLKDANKVSPEPVDECPTGNFNQAPASGARSIGSCTSQMDMLPEKDMFKKEKPQLLQKSEDYESKDIGTGDLVYTVSNLENGENSLKEEFLKIISEIKKRLAVSSELVNSSWYHDATYCEGDKGMDLLHGYNLGDDHLVQETEDLFNHFHALNKSLTEKIVECRSRFSKVDSGMKDRETNGSEMQHLHEDYSARTDGLVNSIKQLESAKVELQDKIGELNQELAANRCRILDLEMTLSVKNEEMETLRHEKSDLVAHVENLQKEKDCLNESLRDVLTESGLASKCLNDAREDLRMLASSMDSQLSARKSLETRSVELEIDKEEVEAQLSELEGENIQLSERISGLEAQLRYLTEERESNRLAIEKYSSQVLNLQNERDQFENDAEKQKDLLEMKLIETQTKYSEAQETADLSRRTHSRLQEKVEHLENECDYLKQKNVELRRQRLDLHDNCEILEGKFCAMQDKLSIFLGNVERLETKLDSIQNDASLRKESFSHQAESLAFQCKDIEEKLYESENLLSRMSLDMKIEIESLQGEVKCLKAQMSMTGDQKETAASNALLEISQLQSERRRLECFLQEVHDKVKHYETKLCTTRKQSGDKMQELMGLLSASKQNEENMKAELEHIQKMFGDIEISDGKSKTMVNELELKVRSLEYDRQKLMEEIDGLSEQVQRSVNLKDKNSALKCAVDEIMFQKKRLEESLKSVSQDYKELKMENRRLSEKVSSMKKAINEGENAKHSRDALEEKVLRLEGDLAAKEALAAHEVVLRNEIIRFKRANSQSQRKVQLLEKERDAAHKRIQALEQEFMMKSEGTQWEEKNILTRSNGDESLENGVKDVDILCDKIHFVEEERLDKNAGSLTCIDLEQSQLSPGQRISSPNGSGKEISSPDIHTPTQAECKKILAREAQAVDYEWKSAKISCEKSTGCYGHVSKIQSLETELAEALEAIELYKVQLKSFLCEPANVSASTLESLGALGEMMTDLQEYKQKATSMETELKDMQERYFRMSLSFAEVEAQREELVMAVRSLKPEN